MYIAEKLQKVDKEMEELRKQYEALQKKIVLLAKQQEKLFIDVNKENLLNPEWLFVNPNAAGTYEALRDLIKKLYGGDFNGPHPTGYLHDGNYKNCQQNFDFWLKVYNDHHGEKKAQIYKNCCHFIENFIHILKPMVQTESRWNDKFPEISVVPFQVKADEGELNYLGYEPLTKTWYHFTCVYGIHDTTREFANFEEAFEFAFNLVDHDDDY